MIQGEGNYSVGIVLQYTCDPDYFVPAQQILRKKMNFFSSETHFYLEICVRLDHFIDIRKGLWRSKD
ncbi:hypothetical protein E2C01_097999 [Portunus trituberculatus]|uniref:Uncharacterized protein n=1 Tax=Portunus trituberculatus TaxID=210409 RepID=A0A5B7K5V6_PORTR|nr:hypothetical protein [Portunus trituberculatus]